jgi:hypothetical protein
MESAGLPRELDELWSHETVDALLVTREVMDCLCLSRLKKL